MILEFTSVKYISYSKSFDDVIITYKCNTTQSDQCELHKRHFIHWKIRLLNFTKET